MNLANLQIKIQEINNPSSNKNSILTGKATFQGYKINFQTVQENFLRLEKTIGKEILVEATIINSNFDLKILQITNVNNQDEIEQLTNRNRELEDKLKQVGNEVASIATAKVKSTVKAKYVTAIQTINELVS